MSLINDALKKAQRERTGEPQSAAPLPGGGSRPSIATGRPAAFRLQILLIGGGALLGLLIATGALLFSRRDQPAGAPAPAAVAATPSSAATEPAKSEPPLSPASPAVTDMVSPASATSEPPLVTVKTTAPDAAPAVVATAPATPATPPPATTKFVNAIETLRVMGIRYSGPDSKVLMNDRVYRVGDIVNHDLGIKLTDVTANSLTFVDATGATYTRYF